MLTLSQMIVRLLIAMALGAVMGWEREYIGKEAGIRTSMLVTGGAAMFAIMGLMLPYIVATSPANLDEVIARNSGFLTVIANIVVGVGFLGAGIIFKDKERVHGLTTAAVVWAAAAIGALVGMGLLGFGIFAGLLLPFMLFVLRRVKVRTAPDRE